MMPRINAECLFCACRVHLPPLTPLAYCVSLVFLRSAACGLLYLPPIRPGSLPGKATEETL